MKILSIEIPVETFEVEISRPPEAMHYDDFVWCIGVNFQFEDKKLTISAPLLGFMKKLIDTERKLTTLRPGGQIVLEDEDQSYQISISHNGDAICIQEAFSNVVASLPLNLFWMSVRIEYLEAISKLESAVPGFLANADYQKFKLEAQKALDAWPDDCQ